MPNLEPKTNLQKCKNVRYLYNIYIFINKMLSKCAKKTRANVDGTDRYTQTGIYSHTRNCRCVEKKNSREKNYFSSHWYLPMEASIHWQV